MSILPAHYVKDLSLAEWGRSEIELAEREMPGLMALRAQYGPSKPLAGAHIAGSLHMTLQTAVLIETLVDLGADVRWSSCNIFSTQDHAAAAVVVGREGSPTAPKGVPVFAWKAETLDEYWELLDFALAFPGKPGEASIGPDLIVDDGGDATLMFHLGVQAEKNPSLLDGHAGSEDETALLKRLRSIHDSDPTRWSRAARNLKAFPRRRLQVSTASIEWRKRVAFSSPPSMSTIRSPRASSTISTAAANPSSTASKRATGVMIAGKVAVVCGFGDVGKGCAQSLRGMGARVVITEIDPICALQAAMEGYVVGTIEEHLAEADIYVTATGCVDVITAEHLTQMKDGAIVCNIGHFDHEIDVAGLKKWPGIKRFNVKPQTDRWVFPDGHEILLLAEGRLVNLGCAQGHPSFVMSASFTNQVLAQIDLWENRASGRPGVRVLPRRLDEEVARLHLGKLGAKLSMLTQVQAKLSRPEYLRPLQGRQLSLLKGLTNACFKIPLHFRICRRGSSR